MVGPENDVEKVIGRTGCDRGQKLCSYLGGEQWGPENRGAPDEVGCSRENTAPKAHPPGFQHGSSTAGLRAKEDPLHEP